MVIQKNSRQVPKEKELIINSNYFDTLYCYLQSISYPGDGGDARRYLPKKEINFSKVAAAIGLSRQTVSTKFNNMLQNLEIISLEDEKYYFNILESNAAFLIEENTLRIMVTTLKEKSISLFVYLLNRYLANKEQGYEFYFSQCKSFLGYSVNTRSNDYLISDPLIVFKKLGLIDYSLCEKEDGRTVYSILWMKNYISGIQVDELKQLQSLKKAKKKI